MTTNARTRRLLIAAALTPVLGAGVLVAEALVAARVSRPPALPPYELSTGDLNANRIVWLGDSTAAGVGADSAEMTLPSQVTRRLNGAAGATSVSLESLAVSGATVADVLSGQVPRMHKGPADTIFISLGANDVTSLTRSDDFRRGYEEIIAALPPARRIVLLGIPDMGSIPRLAQPLRLVAGLRGRQLDDAIRSMARYSNLTYVDIAGATGPAFRKEPKRYFAADDYHPNDAGYALWAAAVTEALATKP